jgi:hypothetical protein
MELDDRLNTTRTLCKCPGGYSGDGLTAGVGCFPVQRVGMCVFAFVCVCLCIFWPTAGVGCFLCSGYVTLVCVCVCVCVCSSLRACVFAWKYTNTFLQTLVWLRSWLLQGTRKALLWPHPRILSLSHTLSLTLSLFLCTHTRTHTFLQTCGVVMDLALARHSYGSFLATAKDGRLDSNTSWASASGNDGSWAKLSIGITHVYVCIACLPVGPQRRVMMDLGRSLA